MLSKPSNLCFKIILGVHFSVIPAQCGSYWKVQCFDRHKARGLQHLCSFITTFGVLLPADSCKKTPKIPVFQRLRKVLAHAKIQRIFYFLKVHVRENDVLQPEFHFLASEEIRICFRSIKCLKHEIPCFFSWLMWTKSEVSKTCILPVQKEGAWTGACYCVSS